MAQNKTQRKVRVPVYRVPSEEDFENFSKDPMGARPLGPSLDEKTRGTQRFYASLRYPDDEVEVGYPAK